MRQPDELDSATLGPLQIRRVQPYEAHKDYSCPGCGRTIMRGTGHYVVVPDEAPDLRRHWHRGCWDNRVPGKVKTPPR
jgi:hypothetical protein